MKLRYLRKALVALLLTAAMVRLLRAAEADSQDFQVYWKAATSWVSGNFPYRILESDHGFVFKYPPWMIPLFSPFAWLGFDFAKAVWAMIELLAFGFCFFAVIRLGVSKRVAALSLILYWYLWLAHMYSGQFTIFLLVAALWAFQKPRTPRQEIFRDTLLGVLFTAKVFSAYSLAGIWKRILRRPVILGGAGFFFASNLILISKILIDGQPLAATWLGLYQGWMAAAASGGTGLGAEVVRGTGNHGFTAAVLRILDPEALNVHWDLYVSLFLALTLGWTWNRASRSLGENEKWAGWLAYGVIVHPLAWHHSFVLAFPFSAFSLEAALRSKRRGLIALSILGTCLIGMLVPQVVGKTIVKPFELAANKSWGVLLCAWALVRARRAELARATEAGT